MGGALKFGYFEVGGMGGWAEWEGGRNGGARNKSVHPLTNPPPQPTTKISEFLDRHFPLVYTLTPLILL